MNEATQSDTPVEAERPVVIAGGSGLVGRRLAAVLGAAGYQVVILTRAATRPAIGPIRFSHWSGKPAAGEPPAHEGPSVPEAQWAQELEGARAVVNLCGESIGGPRWTPARKETLIGSRVDPTRALIQAINAARQPPDVLIQASGVGYYGTGERACTETSGRGTDFLAELAAAWEAPLMELRNDVRSITSRLGVVLSGSAGALPQMLMPFRLFAGGSIATGRQWLSWIHLHDASAALVMLIEDPEQRGIYNLTAPEPIRNAEFARAAAQALGRPSWMFTPRVLLKLLLGEQSTLLCDGQQALPERLQAAGFQFTYPTLERALANLL